MRNENTAATNNTFPVAPINANLRSIENKVADLSLFLAPLQPFLCDEIKCIKDLGATIEFNDEYTYDALIETYRILNELQKYDGTFYRDMVSRSNLPTSKQILLMNLHILYDNARRLNCRCIAVTYDNEILNVLAKDVREWTGAVLDTVRHTLQVIAEKDCNNNWGLNNYEALNCMVRRLNGEVISFYEMGM